MDKLMKVLQFALLGLVILINPLISSLGLLGISLFFFRKHDWGEGFFDDRWGLLGMTVFVLGVIFYVVVVYMPSRS